MSVDLREPLLERGHELGLIAGALERAQAGEGGVIVVEGAAGVGKTRLLCEAASRAAGAGAGVMLATGGELESDLGWGVVRALLAGAVEEHNGQSAGAAALARPIFTEREQPSESSIGTMLHGLFWLVAALAEERPLLLVVDDAQWADMPSLRWLAYMAARVRDLPVVIAVGVRSGHTGAADELIRAIAAAPASERLVLSRLSRDACDKLVESELPGSDERLRAACFDASRGSPFLLVALLNDLGERASVDPDAVLTARPEAVTSWVVNRLAALSPEAQCLTRAVATFGLSSPLVNAALLSGLDERQAASAADELSQAGVLESGVPLRFTHPLVRGAAYEMLGHAERVAWHARAAAILQETGARAAEAAIHLLHVEPRGDAEVVDTLLAAASESIAQGDPNTTGSLLERALREPPEPGLRGEVLRRLGLALAASGDEHGFAHLEAALEATADPSDRGRIALELSRSLRMRADFPRAIGPLERALEELPAESPLAPGLEAELINLAILDARTASGAVERFTRFRDDPDALASVTEPGMFANLALASINAGFSVEVPTGFARSALERMDSSDPESSAFVYALKALACCDELDEARSHWTAMIELGRDRGMENMSAFGCVFRGEVHLWAGMLADAEADASLATDALASWGSRALEPVAILVQVLIERGRVDEADQRLQELAPTELPELWDSAFLLCARSRLRLAQGRPAEAVKDALAAGERMSFPEDFGFVLNPTLLPWRSVAALAMVSDSGPSHEARALAEEELALARTLGARRALGAALRVLALTLSGEDRLAGLEDSVAVLEASPARLEHARSLYALGAGLRRASQRIRAREHLRDALDRAVRCGAEALAREAREELRLAGARPRREQIRGSNALTAAELRVARLAADGHTNREIAQRLFVTARTIETHLTHSYQKLDITSRQQLGNALQA